MYPRRNVGHLVRDHLGLVCYEGDDPSSAQFYEFSVSAYGRPRSRWWNLSPLHYPVHNHSVDQSHSLTVYNISLTPPPLPFLCTPGNNNLTKRWGGGIKRDNIYFLTF